MSLIGFGEVKSQRQGGVEKRFGGDCRMTKSKEEIICRIMGHQIKGVNNPYFRGDIKTNRYYPFCERCKSYLGLPSIEHLKNHDKN